MTIIDSSPLFTAAESIELDLSPDEVYDAVSDLARSGDWSPECRGGVWTGEPGAVGSVFRGENYRAEDVVGWAPLVRGTWYTEAEVVEAERPVRFAWAMRTHLPETLYSTGAYKHLPPYTLMWLEIAGFSLFASGAAVCFLLVALGVARPNNSFKPTPLRGAA